MENSCDRINLSETRTKYALRYKRRHFETTIGQDTFPDHISNTYFYDVIDLFSTAEFEVRLMTSCTIWRHNVCVCGSVPVRSLQKTPRHSLTTSFTDSLRSSTACVHFHGQHRRFRDDAILASSDDVIYSSFPTHQWWRHSDFLQWRHNVVWHLPAQNWRDVIYFWRHNYAFDVTLSQTSSSASAMTSSNASSMTSSNACDVIAFSFSKWLQKSPWLQHIIVYIGFDIRNTHSLHFVGAAVFG